MTWQKQAAWAKSAFSGKAWGTCWRTGSSAYPSTSAYAWKRPHVKDLYDDIRRAIDEGKKDYFLGSVVACPANGHVEIVDGQQRLATTAILIAAIRDHLIKLADTEGAAMLERDYLLRKTGFRQRSDVASLSLSEVDNDFFRKRAPSRNLRIVTPKVRASRIGVSRMRRRSPPITSKA